MVGMSTRIGIVTHPDRFSMATRLSAGTRADWLACDFTGIGCTRNHLGAWRIHNDHRNGDDPADWYVVLEDDAVPVPCFNKQLDAALDSAPTRLVSLYLGRQRPPQYQHLVGDTVAQAQLTGAHYISADRMLHAVGIAIHATQLEPMLNYLEAQQKTDQPAPIDEAISEWSHQADIRTSYTWPSLVDHADTESVAQHSDCEPRTLGRVAYRLGGHPVWELHKVVKAQWR